MLEKLEKVAEPKNLEGEIPTENGPIKFKTKDAFETAMLIGGGLIALAMIVFGKGKK